MTNDLAAGQIYAVRDEDGRFSILRVLVVEEDVVHLRTYATRFADLPPRVSISELSLGAIDDPDGFGIGHFPLSREAFDREEHWLVGSEPVSHDELDGYRMWAEGS